MHGGCFIFLWFCLFWLFNIIIKILQLFVTVLLHMSKDVFLSFIFLFHLELNKNIYNAYVQYLGLWLTLIQDTRKYWIYHEYITMMMYVHCIIKSIYSLKYFNIMLIVNLISRFPFFLHCSWIRCILGSLFFELYIFAL